MKDCKRCEMWKLLLFMTTIVLTMVVLAWSDADATHEPASKRLDFAPVAEAHLDEAAGERLIRAEAVRLCPQLMVVTSACMWLVTFIAQNLEGTEEEISYAVFSTDMKTTALGCMLRYRTADGRILVERSFSETACAKGVGGDR